jgi:hypothetical protein
MVSRLSAAAFACLTVALHVAKPSVVELTVGDHVRVDRVAGGTVERHGDLLAPGTTSVRLAAGTYVFRTGRDAQVRLGDSAAVRAVTMSRNDKDIPPDPKATDPLPAAKGGAAPDRVPTLTVVR